MHEKMNLNDSQVGNLEEKLDKWLSSQRDVTGLEVTLVEKIGEHSYRAFYVYENEDFREISAEVEFSAHFCSDHLEDLKIGGEYI